MKNCFHTKRRTPLKLSKKQEKAIDIACDIMSTVLSSGFDNDEDGSIGEAIDILFDMRIKSMREKEKRH